MLIDKLNKVILLGWASSHKVINKNFGDELSPYVISKLSGKIISHVPFERWRVPFSIIKRFIHADLNKKKIVQLLLFFMKKDYIISIGSLLTFYKAKGAIVWGAGIINRTDQVEKFKFRAVRGKYTRNKLLSLGYSIPEHYGDPAILLPLIYRPVAQKKEKKIGIIPHVIHYDRISKMEYSDNIMIIDLRTNDVEAVINSINSCDCIVSSSLHGLIVAHAYNIKALWFKIEDLPLLGDGIKFYDYFSTVGIDEYKPFVLSDDVSCVPSQIDSEFDKKKYSCLPNLDLGRLQINLLQAAPFHVVFNIEASNLY